MATVFVCAAEPLDPDRHSADSAGLEYAAGWLNIRSRAQDQAQAAPDALTATAEQCVHALAHQGDRGAAELESRAADVDHRRVSLQEARMWVMNAPLASPPPSERPHAQNGKPPRRVIRC